MPRPRVFRAGAAAYPSKIHVKPLPKIVGCIWKLPTHPDSGPFCGAPRHFSLKYVSIPAKKCLAQRKNPSLPVTSWVFRYTLGHLHSRTVPVLRQKPQRFKFIVEAVKLPAENFFVVLLFLFQHGDFVDLSRYDAAGWTVRSSSFLENQKYKNSCKNAWYSLNIRRFGGEGGFEVWQSRF